MQKAAAVQYYDCIPRNCVIRWSHRSRFRLGLSLMGESVGRVLDYGCGDGTFLTMAAGRVETACGVDINPDAISDARQRLGSIPNLRFCTISELALETWHEQRYDVVTCMETLEHCTDESVEFILKELARLVAPTRRVIISVPIEVGIAFLVKSIARKSAAWSGISAYRYTETYPLTDALHMIFAGRTSVVHRPAYAGRHGLWHTHYGSIGVRCASACATIS